LADFCIARTDLFDVLLIKHDVGRTHENIKDALLRRRNAVKDAEKQSPLLPGWRGDWFGGESSTKIATFFIRLRNSSGSESSESSTTLMKSLRFILHPPTSEGTLTSSSRYFRRHHHPFLRCHLRLPLPLPLPLLPRLVLLESGQDHRGVCRETLNLLCSYSMLRLAPLRSIRIAD